MLGGTLTPPRDGVHLRGQDQVSQKRLSPVRIPPTLNTIPNTISSFISINLGGFSNDLGLRFLLALEKFSLPLLPPDPRLTRFIKNGATLPSIPRLRVVTQNEISLFFPNRHLFHQPVGSQTTLGSYGESLSAPAALAWWPAS